MNLANEDLEQIINQTAEMWVDVKEQTIFLTGGTGFFGKWLLESFLYTNVKLGLRNSIIVLTRKPEEFLINNPHLAKQNCITFLKGDIRDFEFPDVKIDFILHAATDANLNLITQHPFLTYEVIANGTKRVLELAVQKQIKSLLYISSGAVYGEQPSAIVNMPEQFNGAPDLLRADIAYAEGKRVAEMFVNLYCKHNALNNKIARCFAFVGPHLPLDGHYAIGNFISNILTGQDIEIKGDGSPIRSYLYATDLTVWLWTILFKGKAGYPYNVGSDQGLSIIDLANKIKYITQSHVNVNILTPINENEPVKRYVPDVSRAKELGLSITIDIDNAIRKTINHYTHTLT